MSIIATAHVRRSLGTIEAATSEPTPANAPCGNFDRNRALTRAARSQQSRCPEPSRGSTLVVTALSTSTVDYTRTSRRPVTGPPGPVRAVVMGRLAARRSSTPSPPRKRLHRFVRGRRHHLVRSEGLRQGRGARSRTWSAPSPRGLGNRGPAEGHTGSSTRGLRLGRGWSVLVIEVVAGRMPGQPWTPRRRLPLPRLRMAERGTPCPGRSRAGPRRVDRCRHPRGRVLVDRSFVGGDELPAWLPHHQGRLGAGARRGGPVRWRDPLPR